MYALDNLVYFFAQSNVGAVTLLPQLVSFLDTVLGVAVPVANKVLQAGVWPLPSSSQVSASDTAVVFHDGYLVAASDITVNI